MLRFFNIFCLLLYFSVLTSSAAQATSSQFGETGLLSQPAAQTLNQGNICVGIWANCSDGIKSGSSLPGDSTLIVPTTITIGLGPYIESYGSYPNLLFNGDEDGSGRGFANAGFKFRVHGKRSDSFRLAVDLQGRRSISDNTELDGLTDYVSRFIATIKRDTFAIHANAGYAVNDSPDIIAYDDQILLGGGIEYSLATRLRLIAEFSLETEKVAGFGGPSEVTAGFQYFVTPHLTMNVGASLGLSEASPNWRVLLGLTTCQGVGTFNRPVTRLVDPDETIEESVAPTKISKNRMLTPLLSKVGIHDSPISHLEVPVTDPNRAVMIEPSDRMKMTGVSVSPIGPMGTLSPVDKTVLPEQPFPAKVRRHFRFPELSFSFNQWDLSEQGRKSISLVAEELRKENKIFIVSIEGHTDDVGSAAYNQILSFRRAVATATHMVLRDGFDPARIFVKGFGENRPIDDNTKDDGRARNRRVELLILVPEGNEDLEISTNENTSGDVSQGENSALLKTGPTIDPLAIEQAIMEKIGTETAQPVGAFSQIGKAD